MDFHSKIGFLKGKIITDVRWTKLMSIKWDRNIFAHPNTKKEIKDAERDAKAMIILAVNQIEFFSKKIKSIVRVKN